ncbi:AraC family transcriptional regulator N-terminal domain-containing protein [Brucella pituitosa]|uniref:AraC family transcriptional regulator N-terminal domain-containing protein n=1 Tax=Brucella pituitosa TaxID=571256 RepID=A0ABS3K5U7_9HYPH|nr:AraC family transcriptional regulator N-terminal domain-containing protein [Brucella pituitosa]
MLSAANRAITDLTNIRAAALRLAGNSSIARLHVYTLDHPTELRPLIYEPVVCLILQGKNGFGLIAPSI